MSKVKKHRIAILGVIGLAVTSYVVFAQEASDKLGQLDMGMALDSEEKHVDEESEDKSLDKLGVDNSRIATFSLVDVNVPSDTNVPNMVGVNAVKLNVQRPSLPTLPGFKQTANSIIGKVYGDVVTEIELIELKDTYVLRVGSAVFNDKMVQSYVKQILDYYSGKKYTVKMAGVEVMIEIKK